MRGVGRLFSVAVVGLAFGAVANWIVMPSEIAVAPSITTVEPAPTTTTTTTTSTTTTTTTTTTTVAKSVDYGTWRCPKYEDLFARYGLLPVETFSYIAYKESRCRPKAVNARWDDQGNMVWTLNKNGSYDSGLLQINSTWKTVTREICGGGIELLKSLDCNLRVAKYLLDNGGLAHWGIKD